MTKPTPAAQQGTAVPADHTEPQGKAPSAPALTPEKARLDLQAMFDQITKASLPQGR